LGGQKHKAESKLGRGFLDNSLFESTPESSAETDCRNDPISGDELSFQFLVWRWAIAAVVGMTALRIFHFYFNKCSLASTCASYNDTDTVISSIYAHALVEAKRSQYVAHLHSRKDDAIFCAPS
jgi:hypothetical protein